MGIIHTCGVIRTRECTGEGRAVYRKGHVMYSRVFLQVRGCTRYGFVQDRGIFQDREEEGG